MTPEFSFPIDIDRIPSAGGVYDIAAPAETLAGVAARLGVLAVERLTARFAVKSGAGGVVHVTGRVQARLSQACVVTLEPVPAEIGEEVEAAFISEERAARNAKKVQAGAEEVVGLDGEDPPDVAAGGRIDLGELAVTQVALVLDPYPRAPGVNFDPNGTATGGQAAEEAPANPFAALAKLKKNLPN